MKKLFLFLALASFLVHAGLVHAGFEYRKDWRLHKVCGKDTKHQKDYCLELIEFENNDPNAQTVLLIPGFFQNAYIWDLLPKKHISVARYLREKWNLNPYVLHVRGIGNSDLPAKSDMDDIAMDDIPMAVDYLNELKDEKVLLLGHSQGAITAQAYLAGISKCLVATCFNPIQAYKRQKKVKAVGLLAGNTAMTVERDDNRLDELALAGLKLAPTLKFIDEIDVKLLARYTGPVGNLPFWEWLYNRRNTSKEAREAMYSTSLDTTTSGIVLQFAKGVRDNAIKTRSALPYPSALKLIRLPVFQQLYEDDTLSEPAGALKDNYQRIGSWNKKYEIVPDRGHEDFFMNGELHRDLDSVLDFLLSY